MEEIDQTVTENEIIESEESEAPEETSTTSETGDSDTRAHDLEAEIQRVTSTLQEREAELTNLREQMDSAVSKYRTALLATSPKVPEELVQGKTIDDLDASVASARVIVEKIAMDLKSQEPSERVPAGAPPRGPLDLSTLSPQEKILYGLQRG